MYVIIWKIDWIIWEKTNMLIYDIQIACENSDYEYFGIRADYIKYQVEDICDNSHQILS